MHAMRDVVILIPGIMGSVLQRNGRDVWGISANAIVEAIFTAGSDIKSLALKSDPSDQDDLGDGVVATRLVDDVHLIPGLWKIDGYGKIASTIRNNFDMTVGENLIPFPYDWRRDNRVAARKLAQTARAALESWRVRSGNAQAKLIFVCHSMGGLVARYFIEVMNGWRDTRALITFGTPYRGSLNALNFLCNGYRGGPLDLTVLVRSLTSVYQLLLFYPCCDFGDGILRTLDAGQTIPNLPLDKVRSAFAFHKEISTRVDEHVKQSEYLLNRYRLVPIVGTGQPTLQSARLESGGVALTSDYKGRDFEGDGTVPRVSATPLELSTAGVEVFEAERHASLQNAEHGLWQLKEVLENIDTDLNVFRGERQLACALGTLVSSAAVARH